MYISFVLGTAGSGKSLLVASYAQWLRSKEESVSIVNLDPGARFLPYTPDVDVRDFVTVDELMDRYDLGPNGALIMAADLIATRIGEVRKELQEVGGDFVLVDTPGQMELFAFRASGPFIARGLSDDPRAVIFLFDSTFSSDPLNYVSNLFLAGAVHLRFLLPQVHVLSKTDLLPRERVDEILNWSEDLDALEGSMEAKLSEERRLLSREVLEAVAGLGLTFELIPVSAKTFEGMVDLHAQLTRIFAGGEEPI